MKPKNVLVMLGLVAVCLLVWFFAIRGRGTGGAKLLPPFMPERLEKSDVTMITVRGEAGGEVKVRRRDDASDHWDEVIGSELVRADLNKIDDLLAALSHQAVRERIKRESVTDADI